jgi:hypothetical protein
MRYAAVEGVANLRFAAISHHERDVVDIARRAVELVMEFEEVAREAATVIAPTSRRADDNRPSAIGAAQFQHGNERI